MEVLTTTEMERADRLTIAAGTPGFALMMSAGQAVAEAAIELVEEGPIVVVAGRGNNGGDGFVAAAELAARGREVAVVLLCERDSLQGDAALAARGWKYPVLPFNPQAIGKPALIIDALFGAGLNRPVKGDPLEMIEAINANGAPVLAVDLPSGINGTTGAVMGVAIDAAGDGDVLPPQARASSAAGAEALRPRSCRRYRDRCARARRNPAADFGERSEGLARILSRAAHRRPQICARPCGRGVRRHGVNGRGAAGGACGVADRGRLVTLASPRDALVVNASALTAVMVRAVDTVVEFAEMLNDRRLNACVIGPGAGVGARTRDLVHTALSAKRHLVLDADALTSFAEAPERLFESIKASHDPQVVLTPHEGEFPRLFSDSSNKHPNRSKLERVRDAAERCGAVVLLKGPDTVVASPDGRASIAANAPPWLATAGSGDVLAGIIAGLLAQGVPAFEAAGIGVWMHGEGAREAGPGLIAEDLTEVLPAVFRRLYDEFGIEY